MSRIQHRLDGKPEMMPSQLRAEIRQEILDDKITRADIRRWVPPMNMRALAAFVETGAVLNDQILTQLEFAWRLYRQGRLHPLSRVVRPPTNAQIESARRMGLANRQPRVPIGGIGPYHHISDPASPLWNLGKERKLAGKKLLDMRREEQDELGISQTNVQRLRHGRVPAFQIPTIFKILEPKRSRADETREQTTASPADQPVEIGGVEGPKRSGERDQPLERFDPASGGGDLSR